MYLKEILFNPSKNYTFETIHDYKIAIKRIKRECGEIQLKFPNSIGFDKKIDFHDKCEELGEMRKRMKSFI